jgi:hypothetical protein
MNPTVQKILRAIASVLLVLGIATLSGLVWWNRCGAGSYRDSCRYSIGCLSFLCLQHQWDPQQQKQMASPGHCSKPCDTDRDCSGGDRCITLDDSSRSDLPPFGKPTKACMQVR